MDYYINEYSLRGQFSDLNEFFTSLREKTLPVLKKIESQKGDVIWKKDTFWQSEICRGITLGNIPQTKNERSGEFAAFRIQLIKLANQNPFWSDLDNDDIQIEEYRFDEEYRDLFEKENCFRKAVENEGRIVSFCHKQYERSKLPLLIKVCDREEECYLDNIYNTLWWHYEPEIRTWKIENKYLIEVRAKEFSYHPPHFHVTVNEYSAVFRLRDGKLYREGSREWPPKMLSEIKKWYESHSDELKEAWDNLHN